MKLITKVIREKLEENWDVQQAQEEPGSIDFCPVLKLFNPIGAATWLLTEIDPEGRLFGLCDLGMQCPELGYVSLDELAEFRGPLGLGIERDMYFTGNKPLSIYADEAYSKGRIVA